MDGYRKTPAPDDAANDIEKSGRPLDSTLEIRDGALNAYIKLFTKEGDEQDDVAAEDGEIAQDSDENES